MVQTDTGKDKSLKNPLFVEFAGLPGSGKTTLSRALKARFSSKGVRCLSGEDFKTLKIHRPNYFKKCLYFADLLSNHRAIFSVLRGGDVIRVFSNRVYFWRLVNTMETLRLLQRLRQKAFEERYEIVILDQALIQDLWLLAEGLPISDGLGPDKLLTGLTSFFGSVVIWVQIDIDGAVQRIKARQSEKSQFDGVSIQETTGVMSRRDGYFEKIIKRVCETKEIFFKKIDGRDEIQANAVQVCAFVEAVLQRLKRQGESSEIGTPV